jgi:NAD(P)-dependent dehydrogenase (short-subunit alcohol dehydrogenase family)
LITGASQGIGAGLARAFAAEGCPVYLTARSVEKLDALKAEIEGAHTGASVTLIPGDLTLAGAAAELADTVGDVDILINNAGVIPSGSLFDIDEAKWRAGWELKVFGYINLCRLYYPRMKAAGGGVILNNIGNGGQVSDPRYMAGAVGNASLMMFTQALGGSSLDDNIRVVGINPGPVDTDRIYNMFLFLASDRSAYTTGTIVTVDGGIASRRSII